jgi:hypothetical protein
MDLRLKVKVIKEVNNYHRNQANICLISIIKSKISTLFRLNLTWQIHMLILLNLQITLSMNLFKSLAMILFSKSIERIRNRTSQLFELLNNHMLKFGHYLGTN